MTSRSGTTPLLGRHLACVDRTGWGSGGQRWRTGSRAESPSLPSLDARAASAAAQSWLRHNRSRCGVGNSFSETTQGRRLCPTRPAFIRGRWRGNRWDRWTRRHYPRAARGAHLDPRARLRCRAGGDRRRLARRARRADGLYSRRALPSRAECEPQRDNRHPVCRRRLARAGRYARGSRWFSAPTSPTTANYIRPCGRRWKPPWRRAARR